MGSTCEKGTFKSNGTCLTCSADCDSCSGRYVQTLITIRSDADWPPFSYDACDSCPESRPVLRSDHTCALTCSQSQYFDTQSGQCESCHSSCSTCYGSSKDECLSCDSSSILSEGSCHTSNCWSDLQPVAGFGVCLEDLVTTTPQKDSESSEDNEDRNKKNLLPIILGTLLGLVALLLVAFVVLRMYNRNRRKEETQQVSSVFTFSD